MSQSTSQTIAQSSSPATPSTTNDVENTNTLESDERSNSKTVILQPGSFNLYLGFEDDPLPSKIVHAIARRLTKKESPSSTEVFFDKDYSKLELDQLDDECRVVRTPQGLKTDRNRDTCRPGILTAHNKNVKPEEIRFHNDPQALEPLEPSVNTIFGDDILRIKESDGFSIKFPMRHGEVHMKNYSSKQQVMQDLADIWKNALINLLELSESQIKDCKLLILVQDVASRGCMKLFLDVAFNFLGVSSASLHHESVCACFGAGMSTACVVNIGHTCTTVSCVEEGLALPRCRSSQPYGGEIMEHVLLAAIQQTEFNISCIDMNAFTDSHGIRQFKEEYCHAEVNDCNQVSICQLVIRRCGEPTRKFKIKLEAQVIFPYLALFSLKSLPLPHHSSCLVALGTAGDVLPEEIDIEDAMAELTTSTTKQIDTGPVRFYGAAHLAGTSLSDQTLDFAKTEASKSFEVVKVEHEKMLEDIREEHKRLREQEKEEEMEKSMKKQESIVGSDEIQVNGKQDSKSASQSDTKGLAPTSSSTTPSTSTTKKKKRSTKSKAATKRRKVEQVLEQPPLLPPLITQQQLSSIDKTVADTIGQIHETALRKDMYRTILLVGGAANSRGVARALQDRLYEYLYTKFHIPTDVAVVDRPRNMESDLVCWKGGAVTTNLKTMTSCWIHNHEWQDDKNVPSLLRERLPFIW